MHYLYRITNTLNNKIYIGQSNDPSRRWSAHKNSATKENPPQYISRAMKKYGVANFIFEVIVTCLTQEDVNETEIILIKQHNSLNKKCGYNIEIGGENSPMAEETKEKMRIVAANRSEDYYDIHKDNKYNVGRIQSEEWKEMIRNRVHSLEERQKQSESLKQGYKDGRISYFKGKEAWNKGQDGPPPANKIQWTDEQLVAIKQDTRSSYKIAEDYGVSSFVIQLLRKSMGIEVEPGNTGNNHSDETKRLISEKKTGQCIGKDNPFFGKSHTLEANEKNRQAHLGKCKYDAGQIAQMKDMAAQGISLQKIALKFNCSAPTIKRMINKSYQ